MQYDITDEAVLDQIVQIVESSENRNRIDKHIADYQIINGNQKQHILDTLKIRYPESWPKITIIDLKIGEKIVRKLSRVYATGVKREVIDVKSGKVDQKMTDLINLIYSDINDEGEDFNDILIKANKYYITHEYVEVFVYEDGEEYSLGKIRIKALPQQMFTSIPNKQKTKAEVVVFKNTVSTMDQVKNFIDYDLLVNELQDLEIVASYTIWSKENNFEFVRIKGTKKMENSEPEIVFKNVITKNDDNPSNINPYDCMPFSAIKRPTEGHFYPYGSEIPQMSKECNLILCDLVSIAVNQGYGQAVIYFEGENPPNIIKSGYTQIIALPNNEGKSRFEFANANADINGLMNVDLTIIRLLLSTNDLTTDKVSGELQATNFASAIDRLIADNESIEFIEILRKKFINFEQKLFNIIIKILEYQVSTQSLPEDYGNLSLADIKKKYKLKISFNSIKPMTTDKEKIDTIKMQLENGLILPYEKHLKFNEDLTVDEAIQREEAIQEVLEEQKKEFLEGQLPKEDGEDENGDQSEQEDKSNGDYRENKEGSGIKKATDRQRLKTDRKRGNPTDTRTNTIRGRSRRVGERVQVEQ